MFALGHSAFAITPYGVDTVGTFDENIHPAYLEDCDHFYRVVLSGVKSANVPDIKLIHGEAPSFGSSTIFSDSSYKRQNAITHSNNFTYYKKKWGGINGEEKFKHPFNDETKNWKYWEFDPEWRKKQEWIK
jgi:GT2 family glycosyltransferase